MPDRKFLINQSFADFTRKSDATFYATVQALQHLLAKSACLLFQLWLAINLHT